MPTLKELTERKLTKKEIIELLKDEKLSKKKRDLLELYLDWMEATKDIKNKNFVSYEEVWGKK